MFAKFVATREALIGRITWSNILFIKYILVSCRQKKKQPAVGTGRVGVSSRPKTHVMTLTDLIVHCVIVGGCQHHQSYRGMAWCLRLLARVIATVFKGWDVEDFTKGKARAVDVLRRAGLNEEASAMSRLAQIGAAEKPNAELPRSVLVWDATSIGRYVNKKIAPQVQGDIKVALKKAAFVGGVQSTNQWSHDGHVPCFSTCR